MNTKTTKTTNINEDFYVQIYFSYVTGDETVTLINRTLGINGVSFWIWLNTTMAKYNNGLFLPSHLDALLYTKDDKDTALKYIQEFKKLNILWETTEGNFTTTFLRDNAFKRLPEAKRSQLNGSLRTKGKSEEEVQAMREDLERQVNEFFEEAKKRYDRKYPIEKTDCYMDLMYDSPVDCAKTVESDPIVKAEEDLKTAIQDVVINGGSAMDFVKSIATPTVEPTYEPKTVLKVARDVKNTDDIPDDIFPTAQELFNEPVNVLPEDYKLLDDETPTEISFDEPKVESRVWQAPTVPPEVQAKIDEQAKPEAATVDTDSEVVKKLESWGLFKTQIQSLQDITTPEVLDAYIRMTEVNGRNKGAYLVKAVNGKWDVSKYMQNTPKAPEPVETQVVATVEPKVEPQVNMNDLIHDNANDSYERYLAVFNASFPTQVVGNGRRCLPLSESSWGAVKWESDIGVINNFLQGIMWLGDEYKAQKTLFGDANVDAYGQNCPIAKLGDKRAVLDYFSVVHEAQVRGDFMKVLAEQKDKSEFARIMFEKYNGQ